MGEGASRDKHRRRATARVNLDLAHFTSGARKGEGRLTTNCAATVRHGAKKKTGERVGQRRSATWRQSSSSSVYVRACHRHAAGL